MLTLDDLKILQVLLSRAPVTGPQEINAWLKLWNDLAAEITAKEKPS